MTFVYRSRGERTVPGYSKRIRGTNRLKRGFASMTRGGVIMDVTTVQQAQIAEDAGAVAVMVLDKLPIDVRRAGGVARPASIEIIKDVLDHTSIPVMAKCRIGHTAEAQVLEATGADMIDESEVLTPADETRHIWKWEFTTPFVCGALDLGSALRRIEEGAAMLRTKGEPGTGNVSEAIKHFKVVKSQLQTIINLEEEGEWEELMAMARTMRVSFDSVLETAELGRLPVINFAAGGIVTPADAAEMMRLGCDGIFVGSGVFRSDDPLERASAIVLATAHWDDPEIVLEAQKQIIETKSMEGITKLELRMQDRGAEV